MADVGVSELKQHLPEYLERASRGESIRVTYRGRPKAMLGPLPGREMIDQGIAEGWIMPAQRSGGLKPIKRVKPIRSTAEVLEEDRGE